MIRRRMLAYLVVVAVLAAAATTSALAAEGAYALSGTPSALQVERLQTKVEANERNVETLRSDVQLMLWPVGILLAVLTLGGLLSVVFSIRDQRRVTQLPRAAMTGETAAQRRSEESS